MHRVPAIALLFAACAARAAGGPLGIDHRIAFEDSGIWKRSNQVALNNALIAGTAALALWEGGQTRLGKTSWQAVDSWLLGQIAVQGLKYGFTRERPSQTDDPNQWFKGKGHYSFPSGEVASVASIVTPFVLEYGPENRSVYLLEALPLYDSFARMRARAHWQTDVLAGWAIGTAAGAYAHRRKSPLVLSVMPHWVFVGVRSAW